MKKFDKGYIYTGLLSDLFTSFAAVLLFLKDHLKDESSSEYMLPIFIIGFAVIYLCFILYRILYYKTSGYELTENEIKCNRGVLFRKRSVLDYRKVHAINKKQNIIHKLFGIAVLTVDSGSTNTSHQAEITIIEKEKLVDALLMELNVRKEGGRRNVESPQPKDEVLLSEEDRLYSFSSGKKLLYTVISIASTAFYTALFAILAILILGLCKLMIQQSFPGSWGQYFLYAFLTMLGAMLVFCIISMIGYLIHSFVEYYKFTVTKSGKDIQISYGLLEKHTNTFSYDRIKAVKISQSLVQRILGFASIRLEVIGYTVNSGDDNKNAALGVLVPFCKFSEVGEILGRVLPDYVPEQKQTKAVSYFPFLSWFALALGIVTGLVLVEAIVPLLIFHVPSSVMTAVGFAVVGVAVIILAVKALGAALSYQNNGLALSKGKITAYHGGFTKHITVFMTRNLIAAENVTTPLRKKAGITSLVMHLKTNAFSNEVKVHIQEDRLAEEIERSLIF